MEVAISFGRLAHWQNQDTFPQLYDILDRHSIHAFDFSLDIGVVFDQAFGQAVSHDERCAHPVSVEW